MNTFDAITNRRAIKAFDPEHVMTEAEENFILSLGALAPTAFNIQNWRFVVVKDKALREKIRAVSWDQSQVTDSSLFVIMCADLKAFEKKPERYNYYQGKDQVQRDEAMRSCGMAAQTLMLAAKAMDYDSCPMDGFDFDAVGELINLPADHVIAMYVTIGKGTAEASPRGGQLPLEEVVIKDTF